MHDREMINGGLCEHELPCGLTILLFRHDIKVAKWDLIKRRRNNCLTVVTFLLLKNYLHSYDKFAAEYDTCVQTFKKLIAQDNDHSPNYFPSAAHIKNFFILLRCINTWWNIDWLLFGEAVTTTYITQHRMRCDL
jgi:hypothetical protein